MREPSVHQLRLLLAVAEELHFKRAAARMFISQPALSQQIRALEERLGIGLVERGSGGARLTTAGAAVVEEARAVVAAMERLLRVSDAHADAVRGELCVGSLGAEAAMPHARAVLAHLRDHHPHLQVEVRNLNFVEQFEALANGEVDAAFLRGPLPPGLQSVRLASEPRVVCLPADDPLAGETTLTLAQLADRTVVDMPRDVPRLWWDHLTVNPRPDGTPVRFGPVVRDTEAMVLAVLQARAITFLPAAARQLYPRPGLVYVDAPELGESESYLAWLPAHRDVLAVRALRDAARATAQECEQLP
ncbi:transcriptional regulator [Streptomyces olivaceoviridis]|uniref:LysR family transcriptional regulator n=1 Tax=Streptomyces olivaceoviridis TaxID=1921 RepID=UPI00167396C0|nr:LysR family transcriptional regulator [Streptomyces olivaceoviridis]GGY80216.1 transcriptional regulator [Streptomyces olivaceoviridis]